MYPFRVKKEDTELIKWLDSVPNRNSYILSLILEDIRPSVLTIKQIKERVRPIMAKHNIDEAYLFGSYSRGEANRSSDVDLYCAEGDVT
ncbi:MAG: nucleotidyltransferase domain-containing protein, partial [Bacilli bacterium]|nr:nucleotidyltransferase domain-containing protein [Bacilli bacterium]